MYGKFEPARTSLPVQGAARAVELAQRGRQAECRSRV